MKHLLRISKDILLRNCYRVSGKLKFPQSIIPKRYYVSKMDIDKLIEENQLYLLRRSDLPFDDTFNTLGFLRESALEPRQVPFLSLNLLGAFFETKHANLRIIKNGANKWIDNSPIFITEHLSDFEVLDDFCLIYIDANKIHKNKIPYSQPRSPELNKEISDFFTHCTMPEIKDKSYILEGMTKLQHDPIILNYWHMELNVLNYKETAIKYSGSKSILGFCNAILTDIICINSMNSIASITPIPEGFYNKKAI